ncbi:unnamed protein product [Gongylonema pulchrum]|uniref:Photolyase/cryptochrome alpha/beta domain-containing protein n=1 Tax=Gongylonema pulchrum TaxID=637853 RepID=A0A3P7MCI6_9BILA|nr:unnamed protein product [Gongylonema pulchrum]
MAQRKFLLEGLICLRNALVTLGAPLLAIKAVDEQKAVDIALKLSEQACEVVTDAAYLRQDRTFEENLNEKLIVKRRRLTRVEGNVCVPVTVLCAKPAFNATTIRKVAWHLLEKLRLEKWDDTPNIHCETGSALLGGEDAAQKVLQEFIASRLNSYDQGRPLCDTLQCMNIDMELSKAADACKTSSALLGGEDAALKVLQEFIASRLNSYDQGRNVPIGENQSFLSAYIHFGMLNPVDIVTEVQRSSVRKAAKDAFLEELVIRRELAHNFVYYYKDTYDTFDCLPDWAKKTMDEHRHDKRKHIYTYRELEEGRTHDPYWNAAQFELVYTHRNRPVFGKLRYMCAEGIQRKFRKHIDEYVRKNYERAGRELMPSNLLSKEKKDEVGEALGPKAKRARKSAPRRGLKT